MSNDQKVINERYLFKIELLMFRSVLFWILGYSKSLVIFGNAGSG
ncbi:hypothetical protein [Photorhabdus temperata]|uniref:Uncharacterized protein n=1 Tax=Photorhabdus temperata J3 TaxID=1389415 RepID=U7QZT5_PHOTE|nr:hypothetical protein [Photorhabdus temperata]ERT12612.1 hypothetical protein O185_13200 [Photorhabdus temperata J3]